MVRGHVPPGQRAGRDVVGVLGYELPERVVDEQGGYAAALFLDPVAVAVVAVGGRRPEVGVAHLAVLGVVGEGVGAGRRVLFDIARQVVGVAADGDPVVGGVVVVY